jgi:hypothetical protein
MCLLGCRIFIDILKFDVLIGVWVFIDIMQFDVLIGVWGIFIDILLSFVLIVVLDFY